MQVTKPTAFVTSIVFYTYNYVLSILFTYFFVDIGEIFRMEVLDKILELVNSTNKGDYILDKEIGLSRGTISNWRLGRGKPSIENFTKVVKYFNISADTLLEINEKSPTDTKSMSDEDYEQFLSKNGYSVEKIVTNLSKLNDKQIKLLTDFIDELVKNK